MKTLLYWLCTSFPKCSFVHCYQHLNVAKLALSSLLYDFWSVLKAGIISGFSYDTCCPCSLTTSWMSCDYFCNTSHITSNIGKTIALSMSSLQYSLLLRLPSTYLLCPYVQHLILRLPDSPILLPLSLSLSLTQIQSQSLLLHAAADLSSFISLIARCLVASKKQTKGSPQI